MSSRVFKKVSTPFVSFKPTAAILMVNMVDPQVATMRVFLEAVAEARLPFFAVANKMDLVGELKLAPVEKRLKIKLLPTSMVKGQGLEKIKEKINSLFKTGDRIVVLGVFNSGKTSLISKLTGLDLEIGDLPGTTLEFTEYQYKDFTLIDTVGQIIDVNKPLMVSVDLADCQTVEEKIERVLRQDAEGILASLETAVPSAVKVIGVLKRQLRKGHKVIVTGAGASALVAMEMAGQGLETGLPILVFTNNLAQAQPISFAKGLGEEEMGLSKYINWAVEKEDVVIGISASGGTGFVYDTLRRARKKGAITVAITENPDTPLGKQALHVIKSNAKPEGPSSSKIQVAHLALAHALVLALADERGVTADQSVKFMLPEKVPTKKMGIK